jgi:hypothetical protein
VSEKLYSKTTDIPHPGEKIERLCRVMCRVRGIDPDKMRRPPQAYFDTANPRYLRGVDQPLWMQLVTEAAEFAACFAECADAK